MINIYLSCLKDIYLPSPVVANLISYTNGTLKSSDYDSDLDVMVNNSKEKWCSSLGLPIRGTLQAINNPDTL